MPTDIRPSPRLAVLYGGFVAGSLDILAAALINRVDPLIILRAIASGLLGRAAFQGGLPVAALGLLLQWAMSLLIAAIFVFAAGRMAWLGRRWIAAGLLYGMPVFVVMEYVVVPLSAAAKPHFSALSLVENLLAMLLFGLIVAFFARGIRPRSPPDQVRGRL
ncbi:hypothetical protein R2APBS1_2356 [Rhodanobacter denitrificans]|uniref:Uncharacterized protein n=2 Tax=Rhodanobacter denitrificans TaxID=666685 RepID=I4WS09_9GAMM|nr:hypothetical protein R2APBS1_2356 [Rhodanobacter denitrificans]EIM02251.1 hypothetical protein UUC_09308 [Rhodanobacter denitrificans]